MVEKSVFLFALLSLCSCQREGHNNLRHNLITVLVTSLFLISLISAIKEACVCVFFLCVYSTWRNTASCFTYFLKLFVFLHTCQKKRKRASRLNVTTCLPTCVLAENERGSEGVWKDGEEMLKSI